MSYAFCFKRKILYDRVQYNLLDIDAHLAWLLSTNKANQLFFLPISVFLPTYPQRPTFPNHMFGRLEDLSLSRKITAGKNQLELCINRRLLHIRFEVGRSSSPLLPFLHSLFYQFIFLSNSTLVSCNINYDFVRKYNFCARIYAAIGHDAVTARIQQRIN